MNQNESNSELANSFIFFVLKFLSICLDNKLLIIIGTTIPSIIAVVYCLFTPNTFLSKAIIIPPNGKGSSPISSVLGDIGGMASLLNFDLGDKAEFDLALEISQSDIYLKNIINHFDLYKHYELEKGKVKIETVIRKLKNNLSIDETDYDNMYVAFEDEDPKMCSTVVAYSYKLLDSLYLNIKNRQIVLKQKFMENKVKVTKTELETALNRLIEFQTQNKIYLPEEQMEKIVLTLVDLEKKKRLLEDEIEFVGKTESKQSEMYKKLKIKRQILMDQLDSLNQGELSNELILTSLKNTPTLIKEYKKIYIDVKLNEELLKFFIKTNEELKFKASTNYEQIQLLSPGFVPQKKFAPPKSAICIVIFTVSLVISIAFAVILNFYKLQKALNSPSYVMMMEVLTKIKFR